MNMNNTIIAPSILSADWTRMKESMEAINGSGAGWVHVDIMDGHFVPNISFGPALVKALRPLSTLPFDVHLMTQSPEAWVDAFVDAGAGGITFHYEACVHSHRLLQRIRGLGLKAGVSIVPSTPAAALDAILPMADLVLVMTVNPGFGGQALIPDCLDKVRALCQTRRERGLEFLVSVDGGINEQTSCAVRTAGADVLVAGSSFFAAGDKAAFVKALAGE
jgi:ribulose-phosphate 3-epimerase